MENVLCLEVVLLLLFVAVSLLVACTNCRTFHPRKFPPGHPQKLTVGHPLKWLAEHHQKLGGSVSG